ncbi:MAG: thiamine-phosphate kinase [Candidatus Obscuribacterales bacterium]
MKIEKAAEGSGSLEYALIEAIKEWTGSCYIGDDCAVLPGQELVSCDTLVEGVHFKLDTTSLFDLGFKAVAVNLSDIAAMAGRARFLLVSVSWPESLPLCDLEELYRGMNECARAYRCRVAGGDFTGGPVLSISVTVLGTTHEDGCLLRSTAEPGDVVVVTGDFGASRAGLEALGAGWDDFDYCVNRHCKPLPRLCESWAMVRKTGNRGALMDASDGLADALFQIARDSNVLMEVELSKVPVHHETVAAARRAAADPLDWALYGGEDYELVGCLSENTWRQGQKALPFIAIGKVRETRPTGGEAAGVELVHHGKSRGRVDMSRAFQHVHLPGQGGA